ncbi:hypothetical protein D3C87_1742590 [compost metagenome]
MGAAAVRIAIERAKEKTTGAVVRTESKNMAFPLKILTKENVSAPESAEYYYYYSDCK